MTRRQQILRMATLCVLALFAGTWLYLHEAERRTSSGTVAPAPGTGREPSQPAESPAPATPLPPRGAPHADSASTLAKLADAGDAQAACRLGAELMRCRYLTQRQPRDAAGAARAIARLRGKGNEDGARALEAKLSAAEAELQACAQLPDALARRALHYFRAAAVAGNATLMSRYASGAGFEVEDGYGYLVTPEFDQWRGEAEALMRRALSQGSPTAALMLRDAHGNDDGLFAGLVADDDLQAYAHARLTERVFGESLAAFPFPLPRPTLPAADAARADALSAEWHQTYFGGRQHDLMSVMVENAESPWTDQSTTDPCPAGEASHD